MKQKVIYIIGAIIVFFTSAFAQKFKTNFTNKSVKLHEVFFLRYTYEGPPADFEEPSFEGFDLTSSSQGSTISGGPNGMVSISQFDYTLSSRFEGISTIEPFKALVKGKIYQSAAIIISATGNGQASPNANSKQNSTQTPPSNSQPPINYGNSLTANVTSKDLFLKAFVSKKKCVVGEQIDLTYKIFSRYDITKMPDFVMPTFDGFWSESESYDTPIVPQTEVIDGINYLTIELKKVFLYPQKKGDLKIPSLKMTCYVEKEGGAPRNIIEQFFGSAKQQVPIELVSSSETVKVEDLPAEGKPENFTGAIGDYSFNSEINTNNVKANESVNLGLTISGNGNIKFIEAPKLVLPEGFETYEPKVIEDIKVTNTISGTVKYNYMILPRKEGTYKLSPLSFNFYNPVKKQYVVLPSPEFDLQVKPDPNAEVNTQPASNSSSPSDIVNIKTDEQDFISSKTESVFGWPYYTSLSAIALAGIAFVLVKKKKINSSIDSAENRRKAAHSKAVQQLSMAQQMAHAGNISGFYNEISIALNNFLVSKLNIQTADLSKQKITETLKSKNVSDSLIEELNETLSICEMAKYAPSAANINLHDVYNKTVVLVQNIDKSFKF